MKLTATYCRVSTSNQEEQQTIKNQINAVADMAKEKGYTIVENYIDDGWSGDTLARPALDKLRQDAKNKVWESVLIYDPDRLARRYSYQELVMDELREAGIEVLFVTTPPIKDGNDKLMYGVKGVFAEWERMRITERFRMGKLRIAKEGHILVTKPLYGYNYIPKQDKRHGYYEINPAEAQVVKMIFHWVGDLGMTLRTVVKKLQELGIKPQRSKRGVWNTSTLSTMLRHRGYIGEGHWGSSYAVVPEKPLKNERYKKYKKTSRRWKPKEEWIIIPIPTIIEPDLFERAVKRLKQNFELCQRNRKNEYLLAGKIYCDCGKRRHGEGYYNKPNRYYRCDDRISNFPLPAQCEEKGVNAVLADKLVWQKVSGLMSSPQLMAEQVERWFKNRHARAKSNSVDVEALKNELKKLDEQIERYNKGYGAGVFNLDQLKEYIAPLQDQKANLQTQIGNASEANQSQLETPSKKQMEAFAEKAKKKLADLKFPAKREIILNTVEKVIANKHLLKVTGYIPVTNQNVQFISLHRNRRAAKRRQIHPL